MSLFRPEDESLDEDDEVLIVDDLLLDIAILLPLEGPPSLFLLPPLDDPDKPSIPSRSNTHEVWHNRKEATV